MILNVLFFDRLLDYFCSMSNVFLLFPKMNFMRSLLLLCILGLFSNINVLAQPVAFFSTDVDSGCEPLDVAFTNAPYDEITQYLWDFGDGVTALGENPTHIFTSPGVYNVCLTTTIVINSDPPYDETYCDEITVSETPTGVSAQGGMLSCISPQVVLVGQSGTINSTFTWIGPNNFVSNTQNPVVSIPGTYTLIVSTGPDCEVSTTAEVTAAPDLVVLSCIVTGVSCSGEMDGALDLTATGGTSPYTYLWSNASTSEDQTGLAAGVYSVTVEDALGCLVTETYVIGNTDPITATGVTTDVSCYGSANGIIDLVVVGGTPGYTYNWSDGLGMTQDVSGLAAGSYTVTITDSNGCSVVNSFTIGEPSQLVLDVSSSSSSCGGTGCSGSAVFTYTGGCTPYNLEVFDAFGSPITDFDNMCPGIYYVTVTDCNGCIENFSFTITSPPLMTLVPTINCATATENGSIILAVSGGTAPYAYQWSTGDFTQDLFDLTPGTYSITITDAEGCTLVNNYDLGSAIQGTTGGNTTYCDGDLVALTVDAPTAVSYSWFPVDDLSCSDCADPTLTVNLGSTTSYSVTVTEADGCLDVAYFNFDIQSYLDFNLLEFSNSPITTGGTLELYCNVPNAQQISWSGPAGFSSTDCEPTIQGATAASEGTYSVAITDQYGCAISATAEVELYDIIESVSGDTSVCEGQPVQLEVVAPTAVSVSWSPATGLSCFTCLDPTAMVDQSTVFTVTVEDGNGLIEMTTVEVVVVTLDIFIGDDIIACEGDNITLCPTFLPPPGSTSQWISPTGLILSNTECVTLDPLIPDMSGCYTFGIFTSDGCYGEDVICITVDEGAEVTVTGEAIICAGESAILAATTSGISTFLWSPAASLDCETCANVTATPDVTTVYTVVATSDFGCQSVSTVLVEVDADCVWPGDTDTNNVVNNFDLLNIGLAYDSVGPIRPNASLAWIGQPAIDWPQTISNGVNYKHVDANGDGTINADDTLAITQNWGEVHNFTGGNTPNASFFTPFPMSQNTANLAPFFVEADTLEAGGTFALPVILGEESNPVEDVYGIAFSLEYDSSIVVPGTAYMEFMDSWFGIQPQDMLTLQKTFVTPGRIDIGMTRIDGQAMTGYGQLGRVFITIEDDILYHSPEGSRNGAGIEVVFNITNVLLITREGEEIEVTPIQTTTLVNEAPLSVIDQDLLAHLQVQPNPASNILFVTTTNNVNLKTLQLYTTTGQLVRTIVPESSLTSITTADLEQGTYLLKAQSDTGFAVKRIVIIR